MGIAETIRSVAEAVKAIFTFLSTTEGQATVKAWREIPEAFNSAIDRSAKWIEGLVK